MSNFSGFLTYAIMVAVIIGGIVCGSIGEYDDYISDGPLATVVYDTRLCAGDSLTMDLHAGDTVRFLGYDPDRANMRYTVETRSGMRGQLFPWDVDLPLMINEKKYTDTIRHISGRYAVDFAGNAGIDSLSGVGPDGERQDLMHRKIRLAVADAEDYRPNPSPRACRFASRERFELDVLGRGYRFIDSLYAPAVYMLPDGEGFEAKFRTGVFDYASGFFSYPVIKFGRDTIATSISYVPFSRPATAAIARHTPLLTEATDFALTSFLARDSAYDSNPATPGAYALYRLGMSLATVVWLILPLLLSGLTVGLLLFAPPARVIPNWVVAIVTFAVALAVAYYWMLVIIVWDVPWWCLVFMALMCLFSLPLALFLTVGISEPHTRCPNCRNMWTFEELGREYTGTTETLKIVKDPRTREVDAFAVSYDKEWIEETDRYGHVEKSDPAYYLNYNVKLEQDLYRDTYHTHSYRTCERCCVCGRIEHGELEKTEKIGREYAGKSSWYEVRRRELD